jgi:small-conductance mechanosensitive channel
MNAGAVNMNKYFTLESVMNIAVSGIVILIAWLIWRVIKKSLRKAVQEKTDRGEMDSRDKKNATNLLINGIKTILIVITALAVMQINGIKITSLVAGLGIFSAVVGLALQDLLKDVIMGIHIMSDDFFKVGDVVQYNGEEWVVLSFNLRTTKIRSIADNDLITICNRNISEITQSSDSLFLSIPVPYEEPVGRVQEAVKAIVERVRKLDGVKHCRSLGLTDFQDSELVYTLSITCPPTVKLTVRRLARQAVMEVFTSMGITIPYPQMDIHVTRGGETPEKNV